MLKTYIDEKIKYTIEIAYVDGKNKERELIFQYNDVAKSSPIDTFMMAKDFLESNGSKVISSKFYLVGKKQMNINIPGLEKDDIPFLNHEITQTTIFPNSKENTELFNLSENSDDKLLTFEDRINEYFENVNWDKFTDTEKIHAACFLEKYCKEQKKVKKLLLNKRNN